MSSPLHDPTPSNPSGEAESFPLQAIAARLQRLDALKAQGLVSEAEHAAQRTRILGEL